GGGAVRARGRSLRRLYGSLVGARSARRYAPLRAALSRGNARCTRLQGTDAVGERAFGFGGSRGDGRERSIAGGRCRSRCIENCFDRRVRALERGGQPSGLPGPPVGVLAPHRGFPSLAFSRVFGVAFHRRDLALQLVTLILGTLKLGLDQRLLRLDGRHREAVAVLHLSQLGANFRLDFLGGRRLVAQVLRAAFAIRQQSALLV